MLGTGNEETFNERNRTHTDDGDSDGADLPSCEFRTRIKFESSEREEEPLPLDRNRCD